MKLYRRGETWWVSHWDGEKQVRSSTGCTDKAEAEKKMFSLYAPILGAKEEKRIEVVARAKKEAVGKILQDGSKAMPLSECWDRYPHVGKGGRTLSTRTLRNAKLAWDLFVRYCNEQGVSSVGAVTAAVANAFHATRPDQMRLTCFVYNRAMFDRIGVVPNPFAEKPYIDKSGSRHREPLSREQIALLLAKADALAAQKNSGKDASEFATYIRFLLYTGLRMGDAAKTRTAQVDFASGQVERLVMDKTHKGVSFPLHDDILRRLGREDEFLFPSIHRQYMKNELALTRRIKRLMQKVGIEGEAQEFCAHALRTTFASICAERDIPLMVIQSWLGHTCPSVTRIYARIEDMRVKKAALAKFPTLG